MRLILAILRSTTVAVLAGDGFDYYVNSLDSGDWPDQHTPTYAKDFQGIAHSAVIGQ